LTHDTCVDMGYHKCKNPCSWRMLKQPRCYYKVYEQDQAKIHTVTRLSNHLIRFLKAPLTKKTFQVLVFAAVVSAIVATFMLIQTSNATAAKQPTPSKSSRSVPKSVPTSEVCDKGVCVRIPVTASREQAIDILNRAQQEHVDSTALVVSGPRKELPTTLQHVITITVNMIDKKIEELNLPQWKQSYWDTIKKELTKREYLRMIKTIHTDTIIPQQASSNSTSAVSNVTTLVTDVIQILPHNLKGTLTHNVTLPSRGASPIQPLKITIQDLSTTASNMYSKMVDELKDLGKGAPIMYPIVTAASKLAQVFNRRHQLS
jgi:hypothetical protein